MKLNDKKIFCLMGPTASGKTDLAIKLIKVFPFDIISVDSAMVYRGMDIGTAKPTAAELQEAPHNLIDIVDPKNSYSAAQFRQDALLKIEEIFEKGRIPLFVGGTMLYFNVLQHGISNLPVSSEEVRNKIRGDREKFGLRELYLKLQKIDPETASSISEADSQRIQRALEVYEISGKTMSELRISNVPKPLKYTSINMALFSPDIKLKIRKRFESMIRLGFVDEVKGLYERGDLNSELPSMRTVGYRHIWQYLSGHIGYEQMLELIPIATNQLVKRQLTWLRRWDNMEWFCGENSDFEKNVTKKINFCLKSG